MRIINYSLVMQKLEAFKDDKIMPLNLNLEK